MNAGGWIIMAASMSFVLGLMFFCFYRVLRTQKTTEHLHAPLDLDTHDKDT